MSVALNQLEILTESIQDNYVMGEWQDISLPLQEYQFASRLFDKAKKAEMGGDQCKWKLETDYADNFQVVELYHRDSSDRKDVLTEGHMPWSMTTANYHYDLDEAVFKRGLPEIVDYISLREKGLMKSFFAGMENLMFGDGPTGPLQRPMPPATLLHWITANATEGFNGAEPTGWSSHGVGGISTTSYPAWKNRTFSYAVVDHDHFVKPIVRALDLCDFKPMPVGMNDIVPQSRFNWEILTTYSRVELLRDLYTWAYQRSTHEYSSIQQNLTEPDPHRLKWRNFIKQCVREAVQQPLLDPLKHVQTQVALHIPQDEQAPVFALLVNELGRLHEGVLARYGLKPSEFALWKARSE